MSTVNLKVVTLNAWGVPIGSANVHERIDALAETLAAGEYDIVLLEEIWMQRLYDAIKKRVERVYTYSHFYRAHIIGSGMCIFSRYPVLRTFYHAFSINGYYDRALIHADAVCGKGVGLAVVQVGEFTVNAYVTHLHAEYAPGETVWPCTYQVHRATQAFELARFITATSAGSCDLVVLGGDLNCRPETLGYRLLRAITSLEDTFDYRDEASAKSGESGASTTNWSTCSRPDNSYTLPRGHGSPYHEDGQRIDHLFCRATHAGVRVEPAHFALSFGKMPQAPHLNYSDHEGVSCTFKLSRLNNDASRTPSASEQEQERERHRAERETLTELSSLVRTGLSDVARQRAVYLAVMVACIALLFFAPSISSLSYVLTVLFSTLVSLVLAFAFWTAYGTTRIERHALENLQQEVHLALQTLDQHQSS